MKNKQENMVKITYKDKVERIYGILEECEAKGNAERESSIKLLQESFSLYNEVISFKGTRYCSRNLSDVPTRINNLVTKLMEYNS
ncbi:MAG: hypothetical protein BWY36_00338 [Candidatus Diapherotrites archaeon ADurb.Bin253]|jgi:hypothetical protein|nr:MAG: hypothetical protein BWY36_00338 [Candidatus Diapherotrites archaeon ADurb.Bin253]HNZ52044.1 hypothetical protein [Candidatus Pacearchaeota archaeon]HOH04126.1 hypothetical protein [Candidatus Pacearchaeota archaeon]HOU79350.1 hypothetical protein [Candidatus Pacearchaeota archaeon]HPJ86881.1 hypothetical protein [Candidatus Pacearchaeota archaeon]